MHVVVISNNTGHVDIVRQDGAEHAFPFDASGTEEEACDAMMQQLQRAYDDRAEARRRGANAARFIRREFSWQVAVRRVVALLRDAGFADNNPATLSWDAEAQQVLVAESAGASVLGAPWWLLPSLAFPVALLLLKAAGWRRGAQRKAALRPVLAAIYAAHNPEMLEGPGAEALLSTFSGQERSLPRLRGALLRARTCSPRTRRRAAGASRSGRRAALNARSACRAPRNPDAISNQ